MNNITTNVFATVSQLTTVYFNSFQYLNNDTCLTSFTYQFADNNNAFAFILTNPLRLLINTHNTGDAGKHVVVIKATSTQNSSVIVYSNSFLVTISASTQPQFTTAVKPLAVYKL